MLKSILGWQCATWVCGSAVTNVSDLERYNSVVVISCLHRQSPSSSRCSWQSCSSYDSDDSRWQIILAQPVGDSYFQAHWLLQEVIFADVWLWCRRRRRRWRRLPAERGERAELVRAGIWQRGFCVLSFSAKLDRLYCAQVCFKTRIITTVNCDLWSSHFFSNKFIFMYLCHSSFLYFSSDPEDLQVSEIFDACKAFMKYCAFKSYPKVLLGQVTWR